MVRGIVFDEDAAHDIERRLRADGYAVAVTVERYAGEDDDADHAWAVLTDAPAIVLDLLLDAHEGWLDDAAAEPPAQRAVPLELPTQPRRRHRD